MQILFEQQYSGYQLSAKNKLVWQSKDTVEQHI